MLHNSNNTWFISLEAISASLLCPIQAVLHMRHCGLVPDTAPMFSYAYHGQLQMVIQSEAWAMLAKVLFTIGHDPAKWHVKYGFHTFKRSGA